VANDQVIVSIGDIATKAGLATGNELIVNAQAIGKEVALQYVNSNKTPSPSAAVSNFQDKYTQLAQAASFRGLKQ